MSPVGPYPDFDACVKDNQDKDDPGAFCAWLEKQTSSLDLPAEKIAEFEKAARDKGFEERNGQWVRMVKNQMITKTIAGVEIFSVGEHNGEVYLEADLDDMIKAFKALSGRVDPPLKVGHTTDEFNKQLARKLGVPEDVVRGDAGNGAMALGWLSRLYREGNILKGDFSDVPQPIADLIESRSYNQVSAEILFDFEDRGVVYRRVLTAVALLGAELPAVRDTAGLEVAAVFTYTLKPTSTVLFDVVDIAEGLSYEAIAPTIEAVETAVEGAIKGKVGAPLLRALLKDIKAKVRNMLSKKHIAGQNNNEEVKMKGVLELLSLKEDATEEEAITAIKALQASASTDGKVELKEMAEALGLEGDVDKASIINALKELKAKTATAPEAQEFSDLKTKVATLETNLATEKRKGRIAHFTEKAKAWVVSGKPEEIAERIVNLEEKDEKAAEQMVKTYQETSDQLKAAGILQGKGTPVEGELEGDSEFEKEVKKYALENHVDHETAFNKIRVDRADLFRDFMKTRERIYAKSPEPAS